MAKKLLDEALAVDDAEAKLKASYAPKVFAALPTTKAARYLQIENKIRAVIRYELAAGIPLVQKHGRSFQPPADPRYDPLSICCPRANAAVQRFPRTLRLATGPYCANTRGRAARFS